MKLVKADKGRYRFQLNPRERQLLLNALERYPFVPSGHFQITKSGGLAENQALLDEALAEQRAEHQRHLRALLNEESPFRGNDAGFSLILNTSQIEWLLQVLNDVRVGAWLALGSPDGPEKTLAALNAKTVRDFQAMEIAGHFQMFFLAALNHDSNPPAE